MRLMRENANFRKPWIAQIISEIRDGFYNRIVGGSVPLRLMFSNLRVSANVPEEKLPYAVDKS